MMVDHEKQPHKPFETAAADFNRMIIKKLAKVLEANPEIGLLSVFPSTYSIRLAQRKSDENGKLPSN